MDVAVPNNFPGYLGVASAPRLPLERLLTSFALDDRDTRVAMRGLVGARLSRRPAQRLAWAALQRSLQAGEEGVFLCTAHPAKFLEVIEETLGMTIPLAPGARSSA